MPKLSIRGPDGQSREVDLDDRDLSIGRGEQNDIVLLDETKSVSRVHAELRYENGQYVLVDANSQNGIWAGGQRLPKVSLQPGVPVLVGSYRLTLDSSPSPAETLAGGLPRAEISTVLPPPSAKNVPPRGSATPPTRPLPMAGRRAPSAISQKAILFGGVAVVLALTLILVTVFRQRGGSRPPEPGGSAKNGVEISAPPPRVDPGPSVEEQVREHLTLARNHLVAKELDDASAEVERALALEPSNADALELSKNVEEARKPVPPVVPPGRSNAVHLRHETPRRLHPKEHAESWMRTGARVSQYE